MCFQSGSLTYHSKSQPVQSIMIQNTGHSSLEQPSTSNEVYYLHLLAMAETFRSANPPRIKASIQCLDTIINMAPVARIESRTRLQLASLLTHHTKNIDLARQHLEIAWNISQTEPSFDDVRLETCSLLADVYKQQGDYQKSRELLTNTLPLALPHPYWNCRLLFQLSQIHVAERDYVSANALLHRGALYAAQHKAAYSEILFLLSQGLLFIIDRKLQEVHRILTHTSNLVDQWNGPAVRKEGLKVFFLVLQVMHFLLGGQMRSVRAVLKQLQQSIQFITSDDTTAVEYPTVAGDYFQWMPKDHLCVLVYLVTVIHAMQAGQLERAQKYSERALQQLEKLKQLEIDHPLLYIFQINLLEHIIQCRLVMGPKHVASSEIYQICQLVTERPKLGAVHKAQLHTLLGLYAMSLNCLDAAELQFSTALRLVQDTDLWAFINLNLAMVYLRNNKEHEFYALVERINPDRFPSGSHCLRAGAYYVRGLFSFFQTQYHESKRYLKETLRLAEEEDLNRLSSCALTLLGHIFLAVGKPQECKQMVEPAIQLAKKIPDSHVILWASALLKDLYLAEGNSESASEHLQTHEFYASNLLKDHCLSKKKPEHNLINWTEGPCVLHALSQAVLPVQQTVSSVTQQQQSNVFVPNNSASVLATSNPTSNVMMSLPVVNHASIPIKNVGNIASLQHQQQHIQAQLHLAANQLHLSGGMQQLPSQQHQQRLL